jgi:hypothetical protein
MSMNEVEQDWVERVGKSVSSIVIVLLAALFVYAYLGPLFFR